METTKPNQKVTEKSYQLNETIVELQEKSGIKPNSFRKLLSIPNGTYSKIQERETEPLLRIAYIVKEITRWSMDYILTKNALMPNDGDLEFFLNVVERFKQSKDASDTYEYIDESLNYVDNSIVNNNKDSHNDNSSFNIEGGVHASVSNIGSGTVNVDSLIVNPKLSDEERKTILDLKIQYAKLEQQLEDIQNSSATQYHALQKIIDAKNETISALSGQSLSK